MNEDERFILMKTRILKSFRWQEDIIIPLSKEFGISTEEMEDIFMNDLDMSSLEGLHGTFKVAELEALTMKFYADLRLCWFSKTLELVSADEADNICKSLACDVVNGKSYDESLIEGRKEILNIIKNYEY